MFAMFSYAKSCDTDISKWDVSKVVEMDEMFWNATSFKQQLCGDAWVRSTASKNDLFGASAGSILSSECAITTLPPLFSPQSREELKGAVDAHLGSEATAPAAGSDHDTVVCKPTVCPDKSCAPIG